MSHRVVALVVCAILSAAVPTPAMAREEQSPAATRRAIDASVIANRQIPAAYLRPVRLIEPDELGVSAPGDIAWDARRGVLVVRELGTQRVAVLDDVGRRIGYRSAADAETPVAPEAATASPAGVHYAAWAIDRLTGNTFVLSQDARSLYEVRPDGRTISVRSTAALGLTDVRGMAVAPSADPTDAPDETSLFVSDAGDTTTSGGVYELALSEPVLAASVAAATTNSSTLLATIDTSQWDPASPDPSGLAYVPIDDQLVVADGEVDETTGAGFHDANIWFSTRQGGVQGTMDVTVTTTTNPINKEAVGVAYDSSSEQLYVSRDGDKSRVWIYQRQSAGAFSQVQSFEFDDLILDAEGVAFDSVNQVLFVADGLSREIWKITRGTDNQFGTADDGLTHFDTASIGGPDPEGIDYDPATQHLWIVSNDDQAPIIEVTTDGELVSTTPFDVPGKDSPGGLTLAPASSGSGDISIFIAERGVDNGSNANENDGRIYEISVGPGEPPPPPPDPGTNVIQNGDFEAASGGLPTHWTQNAHFTQSSDDFHAGAFSGRHQANDDSGYTISQDVAVVGGQAYDFTSWVNVPSTTDRFKIIIKVQWRNPKLITTSTAGKVTRSTTGWTGLPMSVVAPAGATTARVMMVVGSLNATIYVDDLALAVGP